MTQRLALQIALMTLVASCLALVLVVIGGLAGPSAVDMGQVLPLAIASAAAFVIILASPFERPAR